MTRIDPLQTFNVIKIYPVVEDEPAYLQHGHQLRLWDAHPVAVAAVNHVDDRICVGVVTPPVGPVEQREEHGGQMEAETERRMES